VIDPNPETPPDSPLTLHDVVASPFYDDLSTSKLAEGDPAYPFALPTPNGRLVRLEDFRGEQPVALIFGSYT
jgi:hypothetical protein